MDEVVDQVEAVKSSSQATMAQLVAAAAESRSKAEAAAVDAEARVAAAEAVVADAQREAALAKIVGGSRQEAVWSLTKQVHDLQQKLKYAVDVEEVAALEAELATAKAEATAKANAALKAAEAAVAAARQEATLASVAGEARQETVWSLHRHVQRLEEQVSFLGARWELAG